MDFIRLGFIVSVELLILTFVVIFQMIPGKIIRKRKIELQLACTSLALIISLISYFFSLHLQTTITGVRSGFDEQVMGPMAGICGIFFICSAYKLYSVKKQEELVEVTLNPDEYVIGKDIDYDPMIDLTNVKSYAVSGDNLFVFSDVVPQKDDKISMQCRKLADNVYECLTFETLERKLSVRRIYDVLFNYMLVIVSMAMPVLLILGDICWSSGSDASKWWDTFEALGLIDIGGLLRNTLKGSVGFVCRTAYVISYCVLFAGVVMFFL